MVILDPIYNHATFVLESFTQTDSDHWTLHIGVAIIIVYHL